MASSSAPVPPPGDEQRFKKARRTYASASLQELMDAILDIIKAPSLSKEVKLSAILKMCVEAGGVAPRTYVILGSYALRGDRSIADLDVSMDEEQWHKLPEIGVRQKYEDEDRWFLDMTPLYRAYVDPETSDFSIEVFSKAPNRGFPNDSFSRSHLEATPSGLAFDDNGHPYFSLFTLLDWKRTMNRPKDQPDIRLLVKKLGLPDDKVRNPS
jgi:hypothetical protein